jgi:hypothetical protein
MWYRLLIKAVITAAGLCLAACVTAESSIEAEIRRNFGRDDVIDGGHYATFVARNNKTFIRTGSVLMGENRPQPPVSFVFCGEGHAALVSIGIERAAGSLTCGEEDEIWATAFAKGVSILLAGFLDVTPPAFVVKLQIAADDVSIRLRFEDEIHSDPVNVAFAARNRAFAPSAKRVTTSSVAHELHHAAIGVALARRNELTDLPPTNANLILSEGAAEMFGICASLMVDNMASRAEDNHTLNDRPGGILTDAEIADLLKGDPKPGVPRIAFFDASILGTMIANSLWTSTIGPDYFAAGDTEEGKKLLALCANGSLSSIENFRQLLAPFVNDGVDAPAFPAWSDAIGESYFRRYGEAHARWRQKHGLPPK